MKLQVVYRPAVSPSASPYRLLDEQGNELAWANTFLDSKRLVQRSVNSLRVYAYGLLHFARWSMGDPPLRPACPLAGLTASHCQQYVASQLEQPPPADPRTINYRLRLLRDLYYFHFQRAIPEEDRFQRQYFTQSPLGYGRRRPAVAYGLRLREPRRIILPLTADQVQRFWSSFHTFRDLAIVGLMLLDGLRCCEVRALSLDDLRFSEALLCVHGKGNQSRMLPLPQDLLDVLQQYLSVERPRTNSASLFVSLKGRSRGLALTNAGLRSLFRYHRNQSQVQTANPHRFRHTFGADMVRAGISLPALQRLLGHAEIRTTMLYVQIAPQDVWNEYHSAVAKRMEAATR